jgi:hypothetical protein
VSKNATKVIKTKKILLFYTIKKNLLKHPNGGAFDMQRVRLLHKRSLIPSADSVRCKIIVRNKVSTAKTDEIQFLVSTNLRCTLGVLSPLTRYGSE